MKAHYRGGALCVGVLSALSLLAFTFRPSSQPAVLTTYMPATLRSENDFILSCAFLLCFCQSDNAVVMAAEAMPAVVPFS